MVLFKAAKIWFGKVPRKPPDKCNLQLGMISPEGAKTNLYDKVMNAPTISMYFVEDLLYYAFSINIDLCFWIYIISSVLKDYALDLFQLFIAVDFSTDGNNVNECENKFQAWQSAYMEEVPLFIVNEQNGYAIQEGTVVVSNVVISMSAKSQEDTDKTTLQLDSDSYLFGVDTCTGFSICKHRELFVGKIRSRRSFSK